MSNKLKRVDFSGGIRGEDLQHNFDTIKKKLDRERLRIGGFGIVEGFEITPDKNSNVIVGKGALVNKNGEEIIIEERALLIPYPEYAIFETKKPEDAYVVNSQGQIELLHVPYSDSKKGHFDTQSYNNVFPTDEFLITDALNPDNKIKAIRIEERMVTVDANSWAGKRVHVKYRYAQDRLDTILMNIKGDIKVEIGIGSTSPSHVNLERYDDYLIIGLVKTVIGKENQLVPYMDFKTLRKVYVDEKNRLYINGKLYKESQFVHFEEPSEPEDNTLWYDRERNKLLIWREDNGIKKWININETVHIPVKEIKIFSPEENPGDLQTFMFDEEELNLRFLPGHNQIEVIIDNAPLMSDQFEEIKVEEEQFVNTGVGVKLKDPLDKATYVEIRILHSVQHTPVRKTFQKAAVFVNESFSIFNNLNPNKEFTTEVSYLIGEGQLEIYLNGSKLIRNFDFEEIKAPGESRAPSDNGVASNTFRVNKDLEAGDIISYKVTKNVYTYDHIDQILSNLEEKVVETLEELESTNEQLNNLSTNTQNKLQIMDENIVTLFQKTGEHDLFVRKEEELELKNIPQEIKSKVFGEAINSLKTAESIITLDGLKINDFMIFFYVGQGTVRPLIRDYDFTLQEQDGNLFMVLNSSLVDESSVISVNGISLGIE